MKRAAAYTPLNAGVWSPLLYGRADLARYASAALDSVNVIPLVLGGVTRRPGTLDMAGTQDNAAAQLGRFVFNEDQAYILEWTPGWLRFVERGAFISVAGVPYKIASPYQADHLSAIRAAQSADVVYLACRGLRPHKLSRYGRSNWTLSPIVFRDGPYRDPWPTMPSATLSGSTLSFSAGVANADWVGQCIRLRIDGIWYWVRVTAYTSPTAVTVATEAGADTPPIAGPGGDTVVDSVHTDGTNGTSLTLPVSWAPLPGPSSVSVHADTQHLTGGVHYTLDADNITLLFDPPLPTGTAISVVNLSLATRPPALATGLIAEWRAPAWGGDRGWPEVVALFEQRTWWAGSPAEPLSIWASVIGDYETFSPTEPDAKVLDDNGLYLIAADQEVAQIRWLMPGQVLAMGTAGGEYAVRASDLGEALTAANANIRPETSEGSAPVEPLRIDDGVAFVARGGRGLHLLSYDADAEGMAAPDLAQLADHLVRAGVVQLAWCRRPWRLIWCLLADGNLASLTHAPRDQVTAWARHRITDAKVLSIASVPEPGGDALYLVTERTPPGGGASVRRVERMADRWEPEADELDATRAQYLDGARTLVTVDAVTAVGGLDHLNGRVVAILADGATQPARMVVGGVLTLDSPARTIHVGLRVRWIHETLDIDQGGPIGTGQARIKSITGLSVRVHATVAADIRVIVDDVPSRPTPMPLRQAENPMDSAPRLISRWVNIDLPSSLGRSLRVRMEGETPLPATMLALAMQVQTNEG